LQGKRLKLSKGVHLVFPYEKIPLKQAAYFDVEDGRMIFAIPRGRTTYVGTTDTFYDGPPDHPLADQADAVYLCEAVRRMFPTLNIGPEDAESSWCGLRPLIYEEGKSASELSRKDEIFFSPSGLISIAGGKLTGFRLMAEKVIDEVLKRSNLSAAPCITRKYSLIGAGWKGSMQEEISRLLQLGSTIGISETQILEWFFRYGTETEEILVSCRDNGGQSLLAELEYSYRREAVCHPADFMIRRTGMLYFNRPALLRDWNTIMDFFAEKLNYSSDQRKQAEALCRQLSDDAVAFRQHSVVE
jgi:glycerol-3-phosphate dehydrogenase